MTMPMPNVLSSLSARGVREEGAEHARSGGGTNTSVQVSEVSWSNVTRPLRFVMTGALAAAVQLVLLAQLTRHHWPDLLANSAAFVLAAQVNFVYSSTFTWRDRRHGSRLGRRWLVFHGAIAFMAVVNMVTFVAARTTVPTLAAAALGIGVAASGNYVLGDRVVFSRQAHARST